MEPVFEPDWEGSRTKYDRDAAQAYDRIRYAGLKGWLKNALHTRVLARAFRDLEAGSRVLDIPCGTGRFTGWLVERGYRVVAADVSPAMLEVAQAKLADAGEVDWLTADVLHLPYPDDAVDATLTVRFFHLVPSWMRVEVYRELARVARRQVIIAINCNKWSLKILGRRLRGWKSNYWMSRRELSDELASGGLRMRRIHSKGGPLSTLWVVVCEPM